MAAWLPRPEGGVFYHVASRTLVHLAKNGAVAQLGERQNRTLEAVGSIPIGSI